jgi:6-phosphogluconolactonase (cycloisomerase 2 family)
MKALLTLLCLVSSAFAGPTIVYVSESGEKRIVVWSLDESSGDLKRLGEAALPGAPGSLSISPDRKHLYASVRSAKQFATLDVDRKLERFRIPPSRMLDSTQPMFSLTKQAAGCSRRPTARALSVCRRSKRAV